MDVRYSPCMTLRGVLTWVTMALLNVHSVWCMSHPSTLNPQVMDRSMLGDHFEPDIPHSSPLSALWRRRRSLPRQLLAFSQGPTVANADPPLVILLLGKRRHGQEPRGLAWGHTRDYQNPGSLTRPQGHLDNHIPGSLTRPWADKNHQRGGIYDCLTPCYRATPSVLNGDDIKEYDLLGQTLNPGLMADPTTSKLFIKKKKQKKTQEIRQALNRRYTANLMPSNDVTEVSFLKEQQILDELMSLQKMLMKQQQTVKAPSLNDIQGWSWEDPYLLTPREAAGGHLADDGDLTRVHQRLGHVHKPPDYPHTVDGHEIEGHVSDGHVFNLPSSQPLAYFADQKLSAPSESFHAPSVSMDAVQVPEKQPLPRPGTVDPAGHVPADYLQYSSVNDVFQLDPDVTRQEKHNLASLPGANGHFLDNDKDCQGISSKDCLSDMDCSCSGFYACAAGRCTLLQGDKNSANKDEWMDIPKDQLGWMDEPTDQHGWVGGPTDQNGWVSGTKDQYEFGDGPKNQHSWVDLPKNQLGWVDGPTDQHGFVNGPTNQHGWSNDPVMFELVPETEAVRGTEKQVWHEEPFDFSDTAPGADLQPPVNVMFGQKPKNPEFMGSHPVLEHAVGYQFWALGPDSFSDSIQRPDRKTSWSPDRHLLVDELGVVEG